jgi:hypothetical protein
MIKDHPFRVLGAWVALMAALFLLSASGQPDTFWSNGPTWLGTLGWTGFGLSVLGLIGLCVYLSITKLRTRT